MRVRSFRVASAWTVAFLLALGSAATGGGAQPGPTTTPPPVPGTDPGTMGLDLPPLGILGTDFAFFTVQPYAVAIDTLLAVKDAIRNCDRERFEQAKRLLERDIANWRSGFEARLAKASAGMTPQQADTLRRRMEFDGVALQRVLDSLGSFSERCPTQKAIDDLIELFLHAGGSLPFLLSGNIGATDGGGGVGGAFGTSARSLGLMGGGVRVNVLRVNPTFFVETRFQTAFGAASFSQSVPGIGDNTARENWGIPLLLGITVPLGTLGTLPLGADFYGGITIANWTHSLPGADQTRTTIDPTFGAALRMRAFDLNGDGRPDLILGLHGEVSFRQADTVYAQGTSGTIDAHPNVAVMLRVGVPFGKGPLVRRD